MAYTSKGPRVSFFPLCNPSGIVKYMLRFALLGDGSGSLPLLSSDADGVNDPGRLTGGSGLPRVPARGLGFRS